MTRTEELLARAKAGNHLRDISDIPEFVQLIELVRLQQANMLKIQAHSHGSSVNYAWCKKAIAAFNKFEQGGE